MLAFLVGLLVAASPLLRAAWDLWVQSLLALIVIGGCALWLTGRTIIGLIPLPSRRMVLWIVTLSVLSFLSAQTSLVRAYALPVWRVQILGLWIFLAVCELPMESRSPIDSALRICAWILVLLSFYQHFFGRLHAAASLLTPNVFAGTILMLLPVAAKKEDWTLVVGLLICLLWVKSVGAWLGLAAALMLARRPGRDGMRVGLAILAICIVAVLIKLRAADSSNRLIWWAAAVRMAWSQPWLGYGPGSYAYVMPAFAATGRTLSSLYAHQYFLESAAENGIPYLLIWVAGIIYCARHADARGRFAASAVLTQSLFDYTLSIPSNLWLFYFLLARGRPESSRVMTVPARWKLPICAAVVLVAVVAARPVWCRWQADQYKMRAIVLLKEGAPRALVLSIINKSAALSADPEVERAAAELEISHLQPSVDDFMHAAQRLENAARLDPFRASTWILLGNVYDRLGSTLQARGALYRGSKFCPTLAIQKASS